MTGSEGSDITQLWQKAVQEYEKTTGRSLQLGGFRSMDEVMEGTEGQMIKFKDFRDNRGKASKVRTALKNNMWLIQKIVNTIQVVGNTASAFPPAMPASLIFNAFGQVMQSFSDVSADYDKVMGFFEFTHRFFDRISIIDQKMPNLPQFQRCVLRVFSSLLKICAVAQQYSSEKRMKKWFDALLKGTDGELAGATAELEVAVAELSEAVGLTTLSTVQIVDEVMQSMNGNVEFLVSNANLIEERTKSIESNTKTIIEQNQDFASKQDDMTDMQREALAKMAEQSQTLNNIVGYFGSIQLGENFGRGFQNSILKLGVVRLRLTRWSQSVGLGKLDSMQSLASAEISVEDIPKVEQLLSAIMESFDDAETVSKRFEKRNPNIGALDTSRILEGDAAKLHQSIDSLVKTRQGPLEVEDELTLYEEKNFTRLVEDINGFVNDLISLFPAIEVTQKVLCQEEVDTMNKTDGALSLLRDAADGQDTLLTATVTKVIESSTTYNNSVVFQGTNHGFQVGNNRGKIGGVTFR